MGSIIAIQTGWLFLISCCQMCRGLFPSDQRLSRGSSLELAAFCSLAYLNPLYLLLPLFLSFRVCNCRIYGSRHFDWSSVFCTNEKKDVDACIVLTLLFLFYIPHGRNFLRDHLLVTVQLCRTLFFLTIQLCIVSFKPKEKYCGVLF
jgi:hypothetical protein